MAEERPGLFEPGAVGRSRVGWERGDSRATCTAHRPWPAKQGCLPAPTPPESDAPIGHQGDGENSGTAGGGLSDLSKNPQDQFMDVVDKAQAVIPPERYAKRVRPPSMEAARRPSR